MNAIKKKGDGQMINYDSEFDKYLTPEFDIENAHIVLVLHENFFRPRHKFTTQPHQHNKHEFFLVKQGECIICAGGESHSLRENCFIVIPAETSHHMRYQSDDASIFPIKFQFYENHRKPSEINFDVFELLNLFLRFDSKPHIFCGCFDTLKIIDDLLAVYARKFLFQEYFNAAAKHFFINAIWHMYNWREDYCQNEKNANTGCKNKQLYTEVIEEYLWNFCGGQVLLTDLAKILQLSPNHTSKLLKQVYGASFVELLAQTRVAVAKKMIAETDLSLENISINVGYGSYNGFSKAFKKMTGKLPSEFKKAAAKKY